MNKQNVEKIATDIFETHGTSWSRCKSALKTRGRMSEYYTAIYHLSRASILTGPEFLDEYFGITRNMVIESCRYVREKYHENATTEKTKGAGK